MASAKAGIKAGAGGGEVRSLRALAVLEHLSGAPQPLTRGQLESIMGVPKSSLERLLQAMETQGYIFQMPNRGGFVPGSRTISLALDSLRGPDIRRECRGILRNLVRELGETCNLTVPDAGRVLYVERVETTEPLRMHMEPGTWVPMHCTASGKLFLASLPPAERQRVLEHLPLRRFSNRTLIDRKKLDAELDDIARRGIGIDDEEFVLGMIAVAVPVMRQDRRVVAAIACHAPTARLSLNDLIKRVRELRIAAERVKPILFPVE